MGTKKKVQTQFDKAGLKIWFDLNVQPLIDACPQEQHCSARTNRLIAYLWRNAILPVVEARLKKTAFPTRVGVAYSSKWIYESMSKITVPLNDLMDEEDERHRQESGRPYSTESTEEAERSFRRATTIVAEAIAGIDIKPHARGTNDSNEPK